MINFQCGLNCDCSDFECKGNPDPKLVKEFEKTKLIDLNFLKEISLKLEEIQIWNRENIALTIGKLDQTKGVSLNLALTGKPDNPVPLFDCMSIFGKTETLRRLAELTKLIFNY